LSHLRSRARALHRVRDSHEGFAQSRAESVCRPSARSGKGTRVPGGSASYRSARSVSTPTRSGGATRPGRARRRVPIPRSSQSVGLHARPHGRADGGRVLAPTSVRPQNRWRTIPLGFRPARVAPTPSATPRSCRSPTSSERFATLAIARSSGPPLTFGRACRRAGRRFLFARQARPKLSVDGKGACARAKLAMSMARRRVGRRTWFRTSADVRVSQCPDYRESPMPRASTRGDR
jgi:hypothetical protein